MIPIPSNLALLVNLKGDQALVVERIHKGQIDLQTNLLELGKFWKIKVWFNKPTEVHTIKHWVISKQKSEWQEGNPEVSVSVSRSCHRSKTATEHVFSRFFASKNGVSSTTQLCYLPTRKGRTGYLFPSLDTVIKYEPVIETPREDREFDSYEQFKARFDLFFITEGEIQRLWNGKSSQHGGKYRPSDFHRIGPKGKQALSNFLRFFKGINSTDHTGYRTVEDRQYLQEKYRSYHQFGRDISIEHNAKNEFIFYSSEYHNCGNGRYGLLANKKCFLWLEDD